MKTKKIVYVLSLCALICCISCGDDKNDKDGNGLEDFTNSQLTPDEHKAKIENIGKDFIAKFKSSENETIAHSLNDLYDAFENSNFGDIFDIPASSLQSSLLSLKSVITKNDLQGLTRSVTTDEYRWAKYTGIYTYNASNHTWNKTVTSKRLELHYGTSVVVATYSGEKNFTNVDGVLVEVPGQMDITLKVNNLEVLNFTSTMNLAADQKSVDAKTKLTLSTNYVWITNVIVNGSKATVDYKMTIHDEEVMKATAELAGNKMTDPDDLEANEDNLDEKFSSADFTYQIMDITISGKGDLKAIIKGNKDLDYDYNDGDEAASRKYAESSIKLFNENTEMGIYYMNEKEKVANVKMEAYSEKSTYWHLIGNEWETREWNEWDSRTILVFAKDGSKVNIESFFEEKGFSSLIQSAEDLANQFAKMLDLDRVEL